DLIRDRSPSDRKEPRRQRVRADDDSARDGLNGPIVKIELQTKRVAGLQKLTARRILVGDCDQNTTSRPQPTQARCNTDGWADAGIDGLPGGPSARKHPYEGQYSCTGSWDHF